MSRVRLAATLIVTVAVATLAWLATVRHWSSLTVRLDEEREERYQAALPSILVALPPLWRACNSHNFSRPLRVMFVGDSLHQGLAPQSHRQTSDRRLQQREPAKGLCGLASAVWIEWQKRTSESRDPAGSHDNQSVNQRQRRVVAAVRVGPYDQAHGGRYAEECGNGTNGGLRHAAIWGITAADIRNAANLRDSDNPRLASKHWWTTRARSSAARGREAWGGGARQWMADHRPDLVLLMAGINDVMAIGRRGKWDHAAIAVGAERVVADIDAIVKVFLGGSLDATSSCCGARHVVVLGLLPAVPAPPPLVAYVNDELKRAVNDKSAGAVRKSLAHSCTRFIDVAALVAEPLNASSTQLYVDGVHLTARGEAAVAEATIRGLFPDGQW